MRESRTSGSEGGQGREALVYPPDTEGSVQRFSS